MGADKATLVVGGRPMAVRVADALWEARCHPVICQGGDVATITEYGLDARPDSEPGGGPVAAIRDALGAVDADAVVAACDLVDLDGGTVRALLAAGDAHPDADVVVATAGDRRHLLGYWRTRAVPALAVAIDDGESSYLGVLDRLRTIDCPVDERAVRNVNQPDDLA